MLQTVSRLLPELPLILMTAVATHLVMSFAQTLMHYKLGHHPMGGKFFRNHINFHHTYYSKDHLVSRTYCGDEGNNTPLLVSDSKPHLLSRCDLESNAAWKSLYGVPQIVANPASNMTTSTVNAVALTSQRHFCGPKGGLNGK